MLLKGTSWILVLLVGTFYTGLKRATAAGSSTVKGYVMSTQSQQSANAPFLHGQVPNYNHYGVVDISPDAILLGGGKAGQSGAIWSKMKSLHGEWQIYLKVKISGGKNGGDGLAIWYTRDGHNTGPVLGGPDKWTGLGILIDTWDNDGRGNNPAIMGILNDGTKTYDVEKDGEGQYFAGCLRNVRNLNQPLYLRITFMHGALKVELDDSKDGKDYVNCFEKQGLALPSGYFLGISGQTNSHPDNIELLDLKFYGAEVRDTNVPLTPPPLANNESSNGNISGPVGGSNGINEALLAQVETAVTKQLVNFMPKIISAHSEEAVRQAGGSQLKAINDRIQILTENVAQLAHSITALSEHLQHIDNLQLGDKIHHLADDLRLRLDVLTQQTRAFYTTQAATQTPVKKSGDANDGIIVTYGKYIIFILIQVSLLVIFLTVKHRLDTKEKKWL